MDFFQEINKIEELNFSIFNKLLGNNQKPKSSYALSLGNGKYQLGKNSIDNLAGVTEEQFLEYDWKKSPLSFLLNSSWEATKLHIDITTGQERIIYFAGSWYKGSFIGEQFHGMFAGNSFQGNFASTYQNYKSHPSSFVDGTCSSYKDGVLGIPKIEAISVSAGSQRKSVSLLEIGIGYYLNLTDDKKNLYSFTLDKGLDNQSDEFVLTEVNSLQRTVKINWNEIRTSSDSTTFDINSSFFIGKRVVVPQISSMVIGKLTNIEISPKPSDGNTNDVYKLDMRLLSPLKYSVNQKGGVPVATIHLNGPDEIAKYSKLEKELKNQAFASNLMNILNGIHYGFITGYDDFKALSELFNNVKGDKITDPQFRKSMEWLQNFILVGVERMVKSNAVGGQWQENIFGKQVLKSKIKKLLSPYLAAKNIVPPPQPTQTPQPQAINKKNVGKKNKSIIPENTLRTLIRNRLEQNIR